MESVIVKYSCSYCGHQGNRALGEKEYFINIENGAKKLIGYNIAMLYCISCGNNLVRKDLKI